ncbi:unnamed protein product [Mesocestoides corti]|uniref:Uncharacterized protein n=1 Tax=Mesocestoides corti TaxID=53468 RepID=A0A0R3UI15_MESCO|nr:unnamed protein product [Mesocestoides corti]
MYMYRDNPAVDVYGANLYNMCLQSISDEKLESLSTRVNFLVKEERPALIPSTPLTDPALACTENDDRWKRSIESSALMPQSLCELVFQKSKRITPCTLESILVLTGVYQEHRKSHRLRHSLYNPCQVHPCFPYRSTLCEPRYVARDVAEAVKYILHIEGLSDHGEVDVTPCCPYLDEVARSP